MCFCLLAQSADIETADNNQELMLSTGLKLISLYVSALTLELAFERTEISSFSFQSAVLVC